MTWTWAKRRDPSPPLPLFHCRPSFLGKSLFAGHCLIPPLSNQFPIYLELVLWIQETYSPYSSLISCALPHPIEVVIQSVAGSPIPWWLLPAELVVGERRLAGCFPAAAGHRKNTRVGHNSTKSYQSDKTVRAGCCFVYYIECVHLYLFIRRGIWRKNKLTVYITPF